MTAATSDAGRMTAKGKFAWGMILFLGIVHFDFWWWDSDTLVFGFVPLALAFHALISILAAASWAMVVLWDWPDQIEEWANAGDAAQGADDA